MKRRGFIAGLLAAPIVAKAGLLKAAAKPFSVDLNTIPRLGPTVTINESWLFKPGDRVVIYSMVGERGDGTEFLITEESPPLDRLPLVHVGPEVVRVKSVQGGVITIESGLRQDTTPPVFSGIKGKNHAIRTRRTHEVERA